MVNAPQQVPRIGMFATVRNRHGVTTGVEPFDGPTGRLHLVHVEYKDDQAPRDEKLIGELEAETGGWLKGVASSLQAEIAGLDATVAGLRLNQATGDMTEVDPLADSRYAELEGLIERLLRAKGDWLDDERLVVFTEYQTTLDYVVRRLTATFGDDRVLTLFGGMDDVSRGDVKEWFNNPAHPVRVLVATDAAAEGLNLQRTARYLLHFDCPWNPSRIEQRNGRIDRHGQPRDVTIFHFVTDQDQDLAFLSHVIRKADEIREDLGSANEIFDEAAHRGHLDAGSLRDTLESAMAMRGGRPQPEWAEALRTCKLVNPALPGWSNVIDESMRRPRAA